MGNLCSFRAGSAFKTDLQGRREGRFPFIKVSDMSRAGNARFISGAANWVDEDDLVVLKAKPFHPPTIVFAKIGEALKANRFRILTQETLIDNNLMGAIPNPELVNPQFLYYLLQALGLPSLATGSALPYLKAGDLRKVELSLPEQEEQRRIAWVLNALDDKIDSNLRITDLLQAAAVTMFGAWFLDFLWADEFEESAIGSIPRGWSVGVLSDLATVTMGQSPPGDSYSNDSGNGIPLVQGMSAFGERYPRIGTWTCSPTRRASPGATLMTVRAPVGAVNVSRSEVCLGRGVAGIHSEYPAFTELLVRSLEPRWRKEESGTIFPAVNRKQILGIQVVIPPPEKVQEYEGFARPMIDRMLSLAAQIDGFTELRGALLPKLISGEIRVPDTADPDEAIGAVAAVG